MMKMLESLLGLAPTHSREWLSATPSLSYGLVQQPELNVVSLVGSLSNTLAPALQDLLLLPELQQHNLVLNLEDVPKVDAACVSLLAQQYQRLLDAGLVMLLIKSRPQVLWQLNRLTPKTIPFFHTLSAAQGHLQQRNSLASQTLALYSSI